MKRSDLVFTALKVPIDFVMLMAAGLAAYFLRVQAMSQFRPVLFEIPLNRFLEYDVSCSLIFIGVFAVSGLYNIGSLRIRNEVQRIFNACSTSIMGAIVFIFFVQELFSSRFIVLAAWLFSFIFVVLGRSLLRLVQNVLHARGIGCQSVVLIGSPDETTRMAHELKLRQTLGYAVVHETPVFSATAKTYCKNLIQSNKLDEIIVLNTKVTQDEFSAILDFTTLNHVVLRYSADILGGKNIDLATLAGVPLVELKRTRLEGWGRISKRLFDIISSSILIILTLPMMIIIAIAIRLESKGSPIYVNERVGQNGKLFPTLKFRSMLIEYCTGKQYDPSGKATDYELQLAKESSQRKGPIFKVLNDPRRTRVGKFLERFSLDELPQLFNVWWGSMSLVGPRPHMPIQVNDYEVRHHQLLTIKPGISGMAQIEGRSDLDFEDEVRLDIFYMENWSLPLDLIILLKTPLVVLTRKSQV
ncbi:MAG: exopolysaccharide biosynthesis polyprenyl glycosylphosphotransferase [bacterium]|nr:exopolysaccharide biosynthesis polyprenyl glycosylphosphotransferase [bacterium]